MASIAELLNSADAAFAEARKANETRYADILAGYAERKQATMNVLAETYAMESGRLAGAYEGAKAESTRSARQRGLGSVAENLEGGLEADKQFAQGQLQGWHEPMSRLTGLQHDADRLKVIEDRRDVYPDSALYAKVLEMLGKAKGLETNFQNLGRAITGGGGGSQTWIRGAGGGDDSESWAEFQARTAREHAAMDRANRPWAYGGSSGGSGSSGVGSYSQPQQQQQQQFVDLPYDTYGSSLGSAPYDIPFEISGGGEDQGDIGWESDSWDMPEWDWSSPAAPSDWFDYGSAQPADIWA